MVKNLPAMREAWVQSLGREDPPQKGMATHSNILAQINVWDTISISETLSRFATSGSEEAQNSLPGSPNGSPAVPGTTGTDASSEAGGGREGAQRVCGWIGRKAKTRGKEREMLEAQ